MNPELRNCVPPIVTKNGKAFPFRSSTASPRIQPRPAFLAGVFLLLAAAASAQVVNPASSEKNASAKPGDSDKEPIIELSPFVVSTNKDVGYVASSSLAGSRLDTPLRDTAASISVLTPEFLSDIAANNFEEALQWGNNVQLEVTDTLPNDNDAILNFSAFRVRGLPATVTRNYLPWLVSTDNYNVERIEEQRGPNSILFGIGGGGGVLNESTKRAMAGQNFLHASAQVDSEGAYRGTVDANTSSFNGRLALRLNAVYDHSDTWRLYTVGKTRRVDLAATIRATDSTTVRMELETGDVNEEVGRGTTMWDSITQWFAVGRPTVSKTVTSATQLTALGLARLPTAQRLTYVSNAQKIYNMAGQNTSNGVTTAPLGEDIVSRVVNAGGPGQLRSDYYSVGTIAIEQRFGEHTYGELSYNRQQDHNVSYISGQGRNENNELKADPNQFLPDGSPNPYVGDLMIEGDRWNRKVNERRLDNTRLSLYHDLDLGKWGKYRLAAMGEYRTISFQSYDQAEAWAGSPFNAAPENAANIVWRRSYLKEGDWGTYYVNGPASSGLIKDLPNPIPGAGRPATLSSTWVAFNTGQYDRPDYLKTVLVAAQARYFNERLVLGVGLRDDQLDRTDHLVKRDPVTNQYVVDYANRIDSHYSAPTKTLGAVWHFNRSLSAFFNYSNSFDLPGNVNVLPDGRGAGNSKSLGEDYGLLAELADGKLSLRLDRFTTQLRNGTDNRFGGTADNPTSLNNKVLAILLANKYLTQAQVDAQTFATNGITYDRRIEGYELNLTANPTRNWQLQANYSYTRGVDSNIAPEVKAWAKTALPYYASFPQNLSDSSGNTIGSLVADWQEHANENWSLEGLTMQGNRRDKLNFFTNYHFTGRLKGVFVGGGYNYVSKSELGVDANNQIIYGNSYWLATALVGYRMAHLPVLHVPLKVQLNVTNLFDWHDSIVTAVYTSGLTYRWINLAPREWRLTASVEF